MKKFEFLKNLSKKQRLIFGIGSVAIIGAGVAGSILLYSQQEDGTADKLLKQDTFVIEYGEKMPSELEYFVKDSAIDAENMKIEIEYENENQQDFPRFGEYSGKLTYKDVEETFVVEVKDTIAPEFVDFKEEISVQKNAKGFEAKNYFEAKDRDRETRIRSEGNYDLKKVGTYTVKVSAIDSSGNKTTKETKVKVVDSDDVTKPLIGKTPVAENNENTDKEDSKESTSNDNSNSTSKENNSNQSNNVSTGTSDNSTNGSSNSQNSSSGSNTTNKPSSGNSNNSDETIAEGPKEEEIYESGTCDVLNPDESEWPVVYPVVYSDYDEAVAAMNEIGLLDEYSGYNLGTVLGNDSCGWKIFFR